MRTFELAVFPPNTRNRVQTHCRAPVNCSYDGKRCIYLHLSNEDMEIMETQRCLYGNIDVHHSVFLKKGICPICREAARQHKARERSIVQGAGDFSLQPFNWCLQSSVLPSLPIFKIKVLLNDSKCPLVPQFSVC